MTDFTKINQIANKIMSGRAAIIETDTVMGIVSRRPEVIFRIKRRPLDKPLVRLVAEPVQTNNKLARKLMAQFWPGPLTLVINGDSYRMPDHERLLKLLRLTGPLWASSANVSGHEPIGASSEAAAEFRHAINDIFVVRGKQRSDKPSTVYDCDNERTLRAGRIIVE